MHESSSYPLSSFQQLRCVHANAHVRTEVWQASDPKGAQVALKLIARAVDPEEQHLRYKRFMSEAEAGETLRHENIRPLLYFGTDPTPTGRYPTGVDYLVFQWIEGPSLRERLDRSGANIPVPLKPRELRDIAHALGNALAAMHRARPVWVHRDVKPENVLLPDGDYHRAVLADMGIAWRDGSPRLSRIAGVGDSGTLQYMAPEQLAGAFEFGPGTDVYAFGLILWEAATGVTPYTPSNAASDLVEARRAAAPLPALKFDGAAANRLKSVIERALRPDPGARWSSIHEMWLAFHSAGVADALWDPDISALDLPASKRRFGRPRLRPGFADEWLDRSFELPRTRTRVILVIGVIALVMAALSAAWTLHARRALQRPVVALAVGRSTTCALTIEDRLICWGRNDYEALGIRQGPRVVSAPFLVGSVSSFQSVAAGGGHFCALTKTGAPYCWGRNDFGQAGDSLNSETCANPAGIRLLCISTPTGVVSAPLLAMVSLGGAHTCGVTFEHRVVCWGWGAFGQLGRRKDQRASPNPVTSETRFMMVSAGGRHTCAISETDVAYCWGHNGSGQLGAGVVRTSCVTGSGGSVPCSETPIEVAGNLRFATLSAGANHTCGITTSGILYCWGANSELQLGATAADACAESGTGGGCSAVPLRVDSLRHYIAVSAGGTHSCAVTVARAGYCWGGNVYGQLGAGTTIERAASPARVGGANRWDVITAGATHSCGTSSGGNVYCWGSNEAAQLGLGVPASGPRLLQAEWPQLLPIGPTAPTAESTAP